MFDADFNFVNEEFYADQITSVQLDALLAEGWRHFGNHFFRYNLGLYEFDIRYVIPLRIRLSGFSFSKSQRRTLARNADLEVHVSLLNVSADSERLFYQHRSRFRNHIPDSIFDFVSEEPEHLFETKQLSVREGTNLLAESYLDVGNASTSGVYATFDPAFSDRRLGIFTLLKEIEFAIGAGKEFYYLGYSYAGDSFYDYKKRFRSSEYYDWKKNIWRPYTISIEAENADTRI
jgi:arginyl-tRNA--protein-N-Asp/Glu arginylyltransferase